MIVLVSEYLRTPKNYRSSGVFMGIQIGAKINSLFNYMLVYQLEYM